MAAPQLRARDDLVSTLITDASRAQRRGALPDDAVRQGVRAICECARADGLSVERLLVQLKEAWRVDPGTQRLSRTEADAAIARLVSLCIREFYGASARH